LQGQVVFVVHAAQFASVAPFDPRPGVLKHLALPVPPVGTVGVVAVVVAGIVSVIVEETCGVDEATAVVVPMLVQSHA
jgi:hypothetical protein